MKCLFLVLVIFFSTAAAAEGDDVKGGSIYAIVAVDAEGRAEFEDGPNGGLASTLLEQLEPTFLKKALAVHAGNPGGKAVYHLAIDWALVTKGDQRQLQFEYKTSDVAPKFFVQPQYPEGFGSMRDDIKVELDFVVEPDGTVSDVTWADGSGVNRKFFEQARHALEQWRFLPRYEDGVAVRREASMPMVFGAPEDCPDACEKSELDVHFSLREDGQPYDIDFTESLVPDCHDIEILRKDIRALILTSPIVEAVRKGETSLRDGRLVYKLPECREAS